MLKSFIKMITSKRKRRWVLGKHSAIPLTSQPREQQSRKRKGNPRGICNWIAAKRRKTINEQKQHRIRRRAMRYFFLLSFVRISECKKYIRKVWKHLRREAITLKGILSKTQRIARYILRTSTTLYNTITALSNILYNIVKDSLKMWM